MGRFKYRRLYQRRFITFKTQTCCSCCSSSMALLGRRSNIYVHQSTASWRRQFNDVHNCADGRFVITLLYVFAFAPRRVALTQSHFRSRQCKTCIYNSWMSQVVATPVSASMLSCRECKRSKISGWLRFMYFEILELSNKRET